MSTRPQDSKQLGWEQAPSLSPLHRKGSCSSAFYNSLEPAPNLVDWFAWSVWLLWALKHLQRTSLVVQMVKGSAYNAGDLGSIPGWGRSPGEGNGNPLQSSCLENPMDGGAWWATVQGVPKSQTQLSDFTSTLKHLQPLLQALVREYQWCVSGNSSL